MDHMFSRPEGLQYSRKTVALDKARLKRFHCIRQMNRYMLHMQPLSIHLFIAVKPSAYWWLTVAHCQFKHGCIDTQLIQTRSRLPARFKRQKSDQAWQAQAAHPVRNIPSIPSDAHGAIGTAFDPPGG